MGMKKANMMSALLMTGAMQNDFFDEVKLKDYHKKKKENKFFIDWQKVREYNVIKLKKSKLPSTKRKNIVWYVERLIKDKKITLERVKQEI